MQAVGGAADGARCMRHPTAARDHGAASRSLGKRIRLGGGRKLEGPADPLEPSEPGLRLTGDGLDPAERLLDQLAPALALRVAGMAGGPTVDRGAAVPAGLGDVAVLGEVWRGPKRPQPGGEALDVVALVAADRDPVPACEIADHGEAGLPFRPTVRRVAAARTTRPWRFSLRRWPR